MNLMEFRREFGRVKKLGWVVSQRRGPTGVGHTLERLVGLEENNLALPDLGSVELKAHRSFGDIILNSLDTGPLGGRVAVWLG